LFGRRFCFQTAIDDKANQGTHMAIAILPDGSKREIPDGSSVMQLAEGIGKGLAKAAVVAKVDGKLVDLSTPLHGEKQIAIVTDKDPDALYVMRHSTAHIMAQALRHLYGNQVQYTYGPVLEDGRFFYDIQFPEGVKITPDDLPKIEAAMQKIIDANHSFSRSEHNADQAKQLLRAENQRFKDELIDEVVAKGESVFSIYKQGDFTDFCRGPHVPSTGKVKSFKLLSVAGAYFQGDAAREQLTRLYGIAFFDPKQLAAYLTQIEESKKRDHRVIGPQLGLFHQQPEAPGTVFWHDKGWTLWRIIENYIRDNLRRHGYIEVKTPQIVDRILWEKSGHWEKYADLMFVTESEKHTFALKPMNCPCHIQIFNQGTKSYRDLPLRMAEFGSCHRNEPGGTLHGIMRVRAFTQDDAHIFCTEDQIESEVIAFNKLLVEVYKDLGFTDIKVKLSTRPEKRVGSDAVWDKAEKALSVAMEHIGVPYELQPGEGAFYGPKLEYQVADAIGRYWQLGTIQVDFNLPERLGARYVGEDNAEHTPVMLHRAILGSLERFLGILIENYSGAFPMWLAPEQVRILSISEKFNDYAKKVASELQLVGLRVEIDDRSDKIGYKIREATNAKVPYMLVVGEKEQAEHKVALRHRTEGDKGSMDIGDFVRVAQEAIMGRK
jgi:threonyl-tRNA synthetase